MNMAYKYDPNKYNLNKYRNLDIKTQEPEEINRQKITIQSKNADKNSSLKIVIGAVVVMVMLF